VIVVPFHCSERLAEKRRPALVVSNERLHREGYLWIAMITGAGKTAVDGDVPVRDLAAASLPGASIVRTSKLATIEPERIQRRIGSLAGRERAAVKRALLAFLAK
jgi:mRNA interferase MazF